MPIIAMRNVRKNVSTVGIYVINLNRRPDRLARITASLEARGLLFERVAAVDGQKTKFRFKNSSFQVPGLAANWMSHQRVYKNFLKSTHEFALVLEDDAYLSDAKSLNQNLLLNWTQLTKSHKLSLLQIGFVSSYYRLTTTRGLLDLLLALRSKRIIRDAQFRRTLVIGEFRAGAHAYIVSRELAEALVGANVPPTLSSDRFLDVLARNSEGSRFRFARLFNSEIEQESRMSTSTRLDSDV